MSLLFYVSGGLILVVCSCWGLLLCFGIVQDALGTIVAAGLSLLFFPLLLSLAPLYQGLVNDDWMPLALIYGGNLIGYILVGIGTAVNAVNKDE